MRATSVHHSLRYLAFNSHDDWSIGLFTVRDFQLGYKNVVISIPKEATAKDAFILMKVSRGSRVFL